MSPNRFDFSDVDLRSSRRGTPSPFDGPRLVQREELIESVRLFRLCFGGPEIANEEEILSHYVPPRRGGTYAFFQEGRPVSQIVLFHDQIKLYDGTIKAGSIGGVCTHPSYREQRLAGRLLEHCTRQLFSEGARLMLISGDRSLYTRYGNVLHGKFVYYSIQPGQGQKDRDRAGLSVRRATPEDALTCAGLYQAEPAHFVRQKSQFESAFRDPLANPYLHAEPWIVERGGQAVAYLFLGIPWGMDPKAGIRHVSEYAGSRSGLADAIPMIVKTRYLREVSWPVAWQDHELVELLQDNGLDGTWAPLDGHTLRIINFPGFMQDLRPMLKARLDGKILRKLRLAQSGPLLGGVGEDRYTIACGHDRLELDGADMTRLVLGDAASQAARFPASGDLTEVISSLFPLPSFLPGLNYH